MIVKSIMVPHHMNKYQSSRLSMNKYLQKYCSKPIT